MIDSRFLIAVYAFDYFGPKRIALLLSYFGKAEKIWKASSAELSETGLGKNKALEFDGFRKNFNIQEYLNKLKKQKIKAVTVLDKNYPQNLKGLNDAPLVLYYKGILKKSDVRSVAVVGSRNSTAYGNYMTQAIAGELAKHKITIISGLARGIDTIAHKKTLSQKGRTIAVLGSGLNIVYPSENKYLAESIVKSGGAIVSEYPLGYPVKPENFVRRNRIISGMSAAVVVIEGAEKSGTLITARHAAEQGKDVFAVPGPATSPTSFAPHLLIQNGAKLATNAGDILEELDFPAGKLRH
ncbi:MAG TPA: DNA-processing protein DprA [Patescibacteria group bacterium]|nr:DNA-processing protein DprA [Patescibacteria group bacterium]